jgi:phospholipase C
MIIASPWSRGGKVCSEVFDHTSTLQFLEHFVNHKFNKNIHIDNISQWRRTICGNLSSAFAPFDGKEENLPQQKQETVIKDIYNAKFKQLPNDYHKVGFKEAVKIAKDLNKASMMPKQETGTKPSCALPYELYVDGNLNRDKNAFEVRLAAGNRVFGESAAGSPFTVYAPGWDEGSTKTTSSGQLYNRQYAVKAGDQLKDRWMLHTFSEEGYHLKVHGPNGFYRVFKGNSNDPQLIVTCRYAEHGGTTRKLTGDVIMNITYDGDSQEELIIRDYGYHAANDKVLQVGKGKRRTANLVIKSLSGWYDFSIRVNGNDVFEKRYAGHVETGRLSTSDPLMGRGNAISSLRD